MTLHAVDGIMSTLRKDQHQVETLRKDQRKINFEERLALVETQFQMEIASLGNVPHPFLTEYKCSYYFAHKQKYKIVFCSFPLFSGQIFLAVPKVRPGQKTHSRPQTSRGNIPFHTNLPIFLDFFMICTYLHIPNIIDTYFPIHPNIVHRKLSLFLMHISAMNL